MLTLLVALASAADPAEKKPSEDESVLPVVTVLERRPASLLRTPQAVSVLDTDASEPGATHPNELFDAAAGVWVSRGSGQEHLTAIRSPVLTGAGACGAFLLLENGVPIRPSGFCNVNNLFELHSEAPSRVEVIRGPASVLYGSNALHGAINLDWSPPRNASQFEVWVGPEDYERLSLSTGYTRDRDDFGLAVTGISAGSFRELEGFDQQKLSASWRHRGRIDVETHLSATNLNQETAGFIFGENAYQDPELRRSNVNPEAYRDASAARLSSRLRFASGGAWEFQLTPFARYSDMQFLQHFLPGKPLEENGHVSAGIQALARRDGVAGAALDVGLDLDYSDSYLRQTQDQPTVGSAFLVATRPVGTHYDYEVQALTAALYARLVWQWDGWELNAGLRAENTRYDYDNLALVGNTRDDGTACGFGGCLYRRPANRSDDFVDLAPRLSVQRTFDDGRQLYARVGRGFRAPQLTELYRLQRQQSVADLDSEKMDFVDLGYRLQRDRWQLALAAYHMRKRNVILRDADGFNVSDGVTRHSGIELEATWRWQAGWQVSSAVSLARHRYGFDRAAGGGETITSGNEVDTAPALTGQFMLERRWAGARVSAEWVYQDDYFLDAANLRRYGGHSLLHLGANRTFGGWQVSARLRNAANRRYAERADFAFGNFRYFPGAGRQLFIGLSRQF
ncbi:MAG: TonB-dependent receptor [Pseudomonadota bacterium]